MKDTKIELRLSRTDKEAYKEFARRHDMSMSELIRMAIERFIWYIERESNL